jgi:hypothetical protein
MISSLKETCYYPDMEWAHGLHDVDSSPSGRYVFLPIPGEIIVLDTLYGTKKYFLFFDSLSRGISGFLTLNLVSSRIRMYSSRQFYLNPTRIQCIFFST